MKKKTLLCSLLLSGALFIGGCDMMNTSSSSYHSSSKVSSTSQMSTNTTSSTNTSMKEYYGEYKENSYGSEYITKVKVSVEGGVIRKVEILEGSNIYTDSTSWPGNTAWTSKEAEVLKSYEGKTVEAIKGATSLPVDKVTGATLSSNRLFKAIQDALK